MWREVSSLLDLVPLWPHRLENRFLLMKILYYYRLGQNSHVKIV